MNPFPDDDEVYKIIDAVYEIAEAEYKKTPGQGQAYFEDLLIRATISECRRRVIRELE